MIDLDTRARSAAAALRERVIDADLALSEPPAERTRGTGWPTSPVWAMAAGAVTALVLLLGVWTLRPTVVADDVDTSTTVATTVTSSPATTVAPSSTTSPSDGTAAVPVSTTTVPADTTPPAITITSPTERQVFEERSITFAGTTEPGARVFGGPYEATVDGEGNWSIVLILSEGENRATFRAVDTAGNEGFATVTAVYVPPAPKEAPADEPELAPFTAHNVWGECDEDPPYDEYYGTGQPGSRVVVTSEYGSGETTVKPNGEWYVKVFFPEAPFGTEFQVKVKDQYGRYQYFGMTRIG